MRANNSSPIGRRPESAVDKNQQAQSALPHDAVAQCKLAERLSAAGRHEEAILAYDAALLLQADEPSIHNEPAIATAPALAHGHPTCGSFNRANKLSREVITGWSALLRAVPQARRVVGAIPSEQFRNILLGWFAEESITAERLNFHDITSTSDYLALHRLVDVCRDTALQAQDKDALAVLQRAVKLSPADAQAHGNPGNACQDAGDHRAAIECYRRALSLSQRWPKHRFDGAVTHYRQARALVPDAPQ